MASNIVRFDPFSDLAQIQREMNRVFDDAFSGPRRADAGSGSSRSFWAPAVDIKENENAVTVHAELPGVKLEDIDIEMTGDMLTLRGERKTEASENSGGYVHVERSYGSFRRSFTLNAPVDQDKVSAAFKDGILTITLPKTEAVKPKKVAVSAGE